MGYCGRYAVSLGSQNEKYFCTINVQWIGLWGLFDLWQFLESIIYVLSTRSIVRIPLPPPISIDCENKRHVLWACNASGRRVPPPLHSAGQGVIAAALI